MIELQFELQCIADNVEADIMLRRLLIGAIIVGLAQTKILQGKIFDRKGGLAAGPAHDF